MCSQYISGLLQRASVGLGPRDADSETAAASQEQASLGRKINRQYQQSLRRLKRKVPSIHGIPPATSMGLDALKAHVAYMNREIIGSVDYQVTIDGNKQASKKTGSGKWKQKTPEEIARIIESSPGQSMVSIARNLRPKVSERYVIDLFFASSSMICNTQAAAMARAASVAVFAVLQVVFDETKFRLLLGGKKWTASRRANDRSVFACHGRFLYAEPDLEPREEEIVMNPVILQNNTARHMWQGFEHQLPPAALDIWQGRRTSDVLEMAALCPGSDHHAANEMLIAKLVQDSPDWLLVLPGFCRQHDTGNCLQPVVTNLNVARPSFCIAKRLRSDLFLDKFKVGLREAIRRHFKWVKASEHPGFAPREEDMQYARKVLELAYYRRDLHTSEDSEDTSDGASACREQLRRSKGERVLRHLVGNWKEKEVVFWDKADSDRAECHSEGDAIDCVMELLEDIGFHTLGDPAENKWLSVFPVICALTTMMSCHQVFLSALRFSCSVAEGEDDGLSAPSEGEALGAISKDSWAKRERRRQVKALVWSEDKSSKFCCLLFCLVASGVMRLHYTFFKHCQRSPFGATKSYLFKLCSEFSPVRAIVADLWRLLSPDGDWGILADMYGPFSTWPSQWQALAHNSVLLLIGQLNDRLVKPFGNPPYDWLVPLADPDSSPATKETFAKKIVDADEDKLHPALRKIRRKVAGDWVLLTQQWWQQFLFHATNKICLSSAFIECLFATYKHWLPKSGRSISASLLGAKHVLSVQRGASKRKCELLVGGASSLAKRSKPSRPAWVLKNGEAGKRSSRHEYVAEKIRTRPLGMPQGESFELACASFMAAPLEEKKLAQARAKVANVRTLALKKDALAGVNSMPDAQSSNWNISRGSKYLLHPEDIKDKLISRLRGLGQESQRWTSLPQSQVLGASTDFPSSVLYETCIPPSFWDMTPEDKEIANAVATDLCTLIAFRGVKCAPAASFVLKDESTNTCLLIQVCSVWKAPRFRAEFVCCKMGEAVWSDHPLVVPCIASLQAETRSVMEFTRDCAQHGVGPFLFQRAMVSPTKGGVRLDSLGDILNLDEVRAANAAKAKGNRALKLLKNTLLPWHMQPRRMIRAMSSVPSARASVPSASAAGKPGEDVEDPEPKDDIFAVHCAWEELSQPESEEEDMPCSDELVQETKRLGPSIGGIQRGGSSSSTCPPLAIDPTLDGPAADVEGDDVSIVGLGARLLKIVHEFGRKKVLKNIYESEFPIGENGKYGHIKANLDLKQFNAHCACISAGAPQDHRTPKCAECRINRKGNKVPIGLLVAWLWQAEFFTNRPDHRDAWMIISWQERQDARTWLASQPHLKRLIDLEIEWGGGDGVTELPNVG
jgi:hypothetical protein